MSTKETTEAWLERACAHFGFTVGEARNLWIAVRSGDAQAKQKLYQLLRDKPAMNEVFEHFKLETRQIRSQRGLKNPKSFGRPEKSPAASMSRVQSVRVNGVSDLYQGGAPSLGKRK